MHNISIPALAGALAMGIGIGIFYFVGLWWTVQRVSRVAFPGRWVLGSFAVRAGVSMAAFYVIMGDDWRKLMAGLVGFFLIRVVSVRRVRPVRQA
ncbi:MAG: ATP synthase subunit I [Desulfatiglandaceae bacterium]